MRVRVAVAMRDEVDKCTKKKCILHLSWEWMSQTDSSVCYVIVQLEEKTAAKADPDTIGIISREEPKGVNAKFKRRFSTQTLIKQNKIWTWISFTCCTFYGTYIRSAFIHSFIHSMPYFVRARFFYLIHFAALCHTVYVSVCAREVLTT